MTVAQLLSARRAVVLRQWRDRILESYPPDAASFYKRQRDPFANPVGRVVERAVEAILAALEREDPPPELAEPLEAMVRLRSVQQFSPAQATGFIFELKQILRAEITAQLRDEDALRAYWELEARMDRLALLAFDIYARCREQLYDVRVNELKRSVHGLLRRSRLFATDEQLAEGPAAPSDATET